MITKNNYIQILRNLPSDSIRDISENTPFGEDIMVHLLDVAITTGWVAKENNNYVVTEKGKREVLGEVS